MKSSRREKQQGSMFNFVIIGFILVACLVGLIYVVSDLGEQARREQAIAEAQKQAEEQYNGGNDTTVVNDEESVSTSGESADMTSTGDAIANADALPQTGIETSIGSLIAIYALAAAGTGYLISRRKLAHAL
jgi:LPXTG-motif cell wall-anchored protein